MTLATTELDAFAPAHAMLALANAALIGVTFHVAGSGHTTPRAFLTQLLQAAGVARAELEAALPVMIEHALRDPNALTNPQAPGPADVRALYVRAWEGDT